MKPVLIDNRSPTLSNISDAFLGGKYQGGDVLVRYVSQDGAKSIAVASTKTQTIREGLSHYFDNHQVEIAILTSVIIWQKRTLDFQALHTAFLLNSISEEDFENESEKFIIHQQHVEPERIAFVIDRMHALLGFRFDTSDYADYFKCTQKNVMEGLRLLPDKHFFELLPSEQKIENGLA